MAGLITDLIELLDKQYENFEDLAELSREKKDVIVANNIEGLQKILDIESVLITNSSKLEKERDALFKDIASVLNADYKNMTLTTVANIINNKEQSEYMVMLSNKMKSKLDELKTLNEQNKLLIENSLEYTNFTMNLIRDSISNKPVYFNSDGQEIEDFKGFFDVKK